MKKHIGRILLAVAALLPLIRLSQSGPSSILIFTVFTVILLWGGLRRASAKLPMPLWLHYIAAGTIFGGLTQWFVQLEGFEKSFSANPTFHFLQALTIYFWVTVVWYIVLRKYEYSTWDVFWVTGLWGVLFEAILLYGALNPLIWLFIFVVYGSFASIAHLLTRDRFPAGRPRPNFRAYSLAFGWLVLSLLLSQGTILLMQLFGIK